MDTRNCSVTLVITGMLLISGATAVSCHWDKARLGTEMSEALVEHRMILVHCGEQELEVDCGLERKDEASERYCAGSKKFVELFERLNSAYDSGVFQEDVLYEESVDRYFLEGLSRAVGRSETDLERGHLLQLLYEVCDSGSLLTDPGNDACQSKVGKEDRGHSEFAVRPSVLVGWTWNPELE